ncbi:hypothetical protein GCM10017044_15550 [Kordiimonas sediminis]|uniref:Uncharacterized protein n=1 Tax=Kordiimonas sediminis TaxID=1735581 RepID=A0A919ARG7_9PROT|nr:hypothetical protein [Kordiimonas sediminis]GHF22304.1 hypothetical protein GCM10017044_15550 [Kordiimonas sediminis]
MTIQKPAPGYGVTKTQYARQIAEWEATQKPRSDEGLFSRLKKHLR